MSNTEQRITAALLDEQFDADAQDVLSHFNLATAKRPGLSTRKVNIDMPEWMISNLDAEAQRLGISRQSVIKTWLAQKIDNK